MAHNMHAVAHNMHAVINNDDLLSVIFMEWVDPLSCLAVLLVNKRFNALYRLRVPGPIRSCVCMKYAVLLLLVCQIGDGPYAGVRWTLCA